MTDVSLYEELAAGVGAQGSGTVAKIFEFLANADEAKVLAAAAPPASVDEISKITGIPPQEVQTMIDGLFQKGLIFKSKKKDPSRFYRVRNIIQFHDSTAVSKDLSPGLVDLWKIYMEEEWHDYREKLTALMPKPSLRVIPVNISFKPQAQILAFDDVANVIEEASSIAVTACACRAIEGACDNNSFENCIQLNRAADYAIERGTGRELTKAEAIKVLERCEEEGLVHYGSNQRGPGHVICNCCECCCMFWAKKGYVSPSRYQAVVQADPCSGCESCLDRCNFDALSMNSGGDLVIIDEENCMGCGLCLTVCPEDALNLLEVRSEDFVPAS